jgi:glyoxylase-like metal-dependent hydrolase (beta-lactamase superfamily II)
MNSWQVGDVKISCVVEFKSAAVYDPERGMIIGATAEVIAQIPGLKPNYASPEGHLLMAVQAVLVEAPGLNLVVDTCIGNDKPRRMTRGIGLKTGFLQRLAAAGWSRDDVTAVVCTHLHIDHIGWNTMQENGRWVPTFPRARYLMARREYEFWAQDREDDEQIAAMGDSVQPLFDAGLVQLVELDHQLTPEVRLLPSPGHTPGHVCVAIESRGERAVITGDMMHHPCQIARPELLARFDSDHAAALTTRQRLLADWADQPVLVVGTHFVAPAAGYIRADEATYRFEPCRVAPGR